jgi:hypothetical protein
MFYRQKPLPRDKSSSGARSVSEDRFSNIPLLRSYRIPVKPFAIYIRLLWS